MTRSRGHLLHYRIVLARSNCSCDEISKESSTAVSPHGSEESNNSKFETKPWLWDTSSDDWRKLGRSRGFLGEEDYVGEVWAFGTLD